MTSSNRKYILIDESGDPDFYGSRKKLLVGNPGFQPYLILGMIETDDRRSLRKAVTTFMQDILSDKLYNTIPSVATEKGWYVHARGDHPEIRVKFFELLRSLKGYKAHVVVAKKELTIFGRKHDNNPTEFYFDVLRHLLNGRIKNDDCQYNLYLSQRGNNSLHRFHEVVSKALGSPDGTHMATNCVLEIVPGKEMPELSIVDYLIWAVQRSLIYGESRYLDALKDRYESIVSLYDESTGK